MTRRDVYPVLVVLVLTIVAVAMTVWLAGPPRIIEDGPRPDCADIGNGICHPRVPR